MREEARKIVETIKEAFEVLSAMELPAEEQKIEITRDAAMTLIAQIEQAEPVRHGYWIQNKSVPDYNSCSDCQVTQKMRKVCGAYLLPKYCPDCGAKVDAAT